MFQFTTETDTVFIFEIPRKTAVTQYLLLTVWQRAKSSAKEKFINSVGADNFLSNYHFQ